MYQQDEAKEEAFLAALETEAQTLDNLAQKISISFTDVDIETIKSDAMEFYHMGGGNCDDKIPHLSLKRVHEIY